MFTKSLNFNTGYILIIHNLKDKYPFLFLIFFILISGNNFTKGQTISNLDIFYILTDSVATEIVTAIGSEKELLLTINYPVDYSLLRNRIILSLNQNDYKVNEITGSNINNISVFIDSAFVNYYDLSRNGLFGSYHISRKVILSGNYQHLIDNELKREGEFSYSFNDRIPFESVQNVEFYSIPYTQGEKPAEPFLASIIEPVIAIGTAAAAIILFFTIRSK